MSDGEAIEPEDKWIPEGSADVDPEERNDAPMANAAESANPEQVRVPEAVTGGTPQKEIPAAGDEPTAAKGATPRSSMEETARPGTATSEWLAVPKPNPSDSKPNQSDSNGAEATDAAPGLRPVGSHKPDSSRDRIRSEPVVPEEPRQGSRIGGALSQWRRLSASLRGVKEDLQAQTTEIARLESQLVETQAMLAGETANSSRIAERLDAELTTARGASQRAAERLNRLQDQLTSQGAEIARVTQSGEESRKGFKKSLETTQNEFTERLEALERKAESEVAAANQRAKQREGVIRGRLADATEELAKKAASQATLTEQRAQEREEAIQGQLASATERLEKELATQASRVELLEKEIGSKITALDGRIKKREQKRRGEQKEISRREHAATADGLAKKFDSAISALDKRITKREEEIKRQASAAAEAEVVTQIEDVERRLKQREQTTRRQFADAAEDLEQRINTEFTDTLERIKKDDATARRQIADAMEQLERAQTAFEAQPKRALAGVSEKPEKIKLPKGKLDVNSLTFEQFRALGLSLTQSSRLIALRDRTEGFSDIDEIDGVVGLPADLRQTLKRRLIIKS